MPLLKPLPLFPSRLDAHRPNAQISTGPRSGAGKARSRMNPNSEVARLDCKKPPHPAGYARHPLPMVGCVITPASLRRRRRFRVRQLAAALARPACRPCSGVRRQFGREQARSEKAAASCRTPKLRTEGWVLICDGVVTQTPRERAVIDVSFQPTPEGRWWPTAGDFTRSGTRKKIVFYTTEASMSMKTKRRVHKMRHKRAQIYTDLTAEIAQIGSWREPICSFFARFCMLTASWLA